MSHKAYGLIGILALVSGVVSACGSSSHSNSTSSSTAPTGSSPTAAAPTGSTIKLGVISSDTSADGNNQDVPQTTKRWEAYVNSHGGINGHAVKVIEMDDSSSPATALQDFQTLQQDGVVAIGDYSFVDTAFQKQADAANIPVINLGTPSFAFGTDPNFFTPTPEGVKPSLWSFGEMSTLTGKKNFGYIYCAEVAACAQGVPIIKSALESVGAKMAYSGSFSATAPNYIAQCVAAKNAGADLLFASGPSPTAGLRVIDDCAQQNYYPEVILPGQTTPKNVLSDKNIKSAIGVTQVMPFFLRNSATASFHAAMDSYIPQAGSIGLALTLYWAGLTTFETAAQLGIPASADPTTQGIYDGLYSFKQNTLGGLVGPLTFVKGQPHNQFCDFFFGMGNGQFTTPYGSSPKCVPGVTPT